MKGIRFESASTSNDTSRIEHCIIRHGNANVGSGNDLYGGGIFVYSFSKLVIRSNFITNNQASQDGGGICCYQSASPKIINNVIVNNSAYRGGGIAIRYSANPDVYNNTIANNVGSYSTSGSAIYRSSGTPDIKNNIIYGNTGTSYQIYPTSGITVQYCDVQGGYTGTGNIDSDPKFKNPTSGSGVNYNGLQADWSLQETSPCIDAGTPTITGMGLPAYDLLGKTRNYSAAVDMGAYEDKSSLSACGTISSNTVWDANTINVNCDVTVANGATLTILPGTKVKFAGNYQLKILGALYAVGTSTDTIRFTSDYPSVGWKGIRIEDPSNSNDSTIIHNCLIEKVIYGNNDGGGIYIFGFNKVRITNSMIRDNANSTGTGGGVYLRASSAIFKNNVIRNNSAKYGAGLAGYGCYSNIENNIIRQNVAERMGGGLYLNYSGPLVMNNLISNNTVTYSSSSASYGGAGVAVYGYQPAVFINNIIVNNESAYNGGGVHVQYDAKSVFFNNTISNNKAIRGGGLFVYNNADPVFKNTVFYHDSATAVLSGNEVYIYDVTSDPKFYNCIVEGGKLLFSGTGSQLNYNGVFSENIQSDPEFLSPSSDAGSAVAGYNANWNIDSISPCINTGTSDTSGLGYIEYDFGGNSRVHRGRIDIGAYENQQDIYSQCTISTNTTWEADTIKVACDVSIANGVTLSISPGTYVEFQGYYKIDVQGQLLALGTADEPITFSVKDTSGFIDMSATNGSWNGIEFNSTPISNDSSKLVYCILKYGKAKESSAYSSMGGALFIYNYSKVLVSNCIITNNQSYYYGGGIYIESSNPVIKNSIICNNSATGSSYGYGGGIYMDDASPLFFNNLVAYNYSKYYGGGIYMRATIASFKNNIILKNQGHYSSVSYYSPDIHVSSGSNLSLYNNMLDGNKNNIPGYSSISVFQNNLDDDPLFTNPPDSMGAKYDGLSANWHLDQNSPCINSGTSSLSGYVGSEDYFGYARLVADTLDIGHAEVQLSQRFITTQPQAQTACVGGSATFTTTIGVSANYQWQKNGQNIPGETSSSLSLHSITLADTGNYACVFSNDFGSVNSDVVSLTVQTPPVLTLQPASASRCLNDSVTFMVQAVGTQPITYQWQNTSGNLQGSVPMSFYTIGTASSTNTATSYPAPYGNFYWGARHQFLITASELTAAGISAGDIQSLAFDVTNANNCPGLDNFTIKIGQTSVSALTSTWESGLTTVYQSTSYQPTVGWNTHTFQTPISWDGTSNLVIETCFNNSSYVNQGNASIRFTSTSYNSAHERHADAINVCTLTDGYLHTTRPVVKLLVGSETSNYYINAVSQNDATTYKCNVSNVCGSQLSNGAVLTIKTPPSVSSLPGTYTLCETNPIPLSVTATGNPTPSYQWYKDSVALAGANTHQLNISAANVSDAGDYYCKASNICGEDSTNIASVIVDEEPSISSQSSSSAVCEGQSYTISVTASGAQPLSYQWYKNGSSIAGATNNTYTISSLSSTDAGTYVCRVTNSCAYVESNGIVLTIKSAPSITSQSSGATVCENAAHSFSVTASGTATLSYQWYNSSGQIGGATNNSYNIGSVSTSNEDNYYCIVSNTCGTAQSTSISLSVKTAPVIGTNPSSLTKCEGQSAQFTIQASGSSPISYQWYKSPGTSISGANSSSMLISPVGSSDAGAYYCKATNSCGYDQSNSATLTVNNAAEITAQSSSATVCQGSSHTMTVTATGSGSLSYQWYNSSGAISGASNNTYTIGSVSTTHADNYYCIVSNSCGSDQSNTISLTVNTAPSIANQPSSSTVCEGQSAVFTISGDGTSPLSYQWYDGSGAISGASSSSYLIAGVTSSNADNYYCKITNACGNVTSTTASLSVNTNVSISAQSASTTLCEGASPSFSVTASGSSPLTYQWYKDNSAISGATNNTFSLTSIDTSYEATYHVLVSNACNSQQSSPIILSVKQAPTISTQPASASVCENQSSSFMVSADGTAPLSYQWYDGSGSISGATSNSYLISSVSTSNAGTYYCKVSNSCGYVNSNSAVLIVNSNVSISAQSSSKTVCTGASPSFSITASGTSPISYQWYKDNSSIASATNNSLNLTSVDTSDAGYYYVVASNTCNSVQSGNMLLTVNQAPVVNSQPLSQTACSGSGVQFSMNAQGTAPLSYQWYYSGIAIINAVSDNYQISSVGSANAGSYYAVVSNSCGSQNTNTVNLTVNNPVSISYTSPDELECSGNSATFYVTASGTGPLSYQWYLNGSALSGATSSSLNIAQVDSTDAGDYYCMVSNSCNTVQSSTRSLTVNYAPSISQQSSGSTLCDGENVSLSVAALGSGTLSYQWYKDASQISGANSPVYPLYQLSASDAGTYYCVVSNSCGSVNSSNMVVNVNQSPSIASQSQSQSICENATAVLSVNGNGTSPLHYQWYNASGAIGGALSSSYTLTSVDTSDADTYYCRVANMCDTVYSSNITLTVNQAPAILTQSSGANKCEGSAFSFSVSASGTAPLNYQWYSSSGAISGAVNSLYLINSVDTSDAGSYYCVVTNSCGSATSTNKVLAVSQAPSFLSQSTSATKCEGSSMLFTVNANGTSPLAYQWYVDTGMVAGAQANSYTIPSINVLNSGNYYCTVSNTCGTITSSVKTLNVNQAPGFLSQSASDTLCEGQSMVFNVNTTGTSPISYQWYKNGNMINGAVNSLFMIASVDTLDAANYHVIANNVCGNLQSNTMSLEVNSPVQINYQSGDSSRCEGESVSMAVQASGTAPITYQWYKSGTSMSNQTSSSFNLSNLDVSDAGYYQCVVSNMCNSVSSTNKVITVHTNPQPTLGQDTSFCLGGQVNLTPGFGYNCIWSNGSFNNQITVTQSGTFWVDVVDNYGCTGRSDTVSINVAEPYANNNLCIVGVDSATQKNVVVWEKTPNVGIVSYNVYREASTTGVWTLIENKPFDSLAVVYDLTSSPLSHADRYAITALDTCGNESALSSPHKTMFLAVSPGVPNGYNLIWNGYQGFTVATYRIWRADSTGIYSKIDSVNGNIFMWHDTTSAQQPFTYQVEVVKPGGPCNPSKANTNYNTSRSNPATNGFNVPNSLLADFIATPTQGIAPLVVTFYDQSIGDPTGWYWNFGDGKTSTQQNPAHQYDTIGIYDVTLTVTNADGVNSKTKFAFIDVMPDGIVSLKEVLDLSVFPNPYRNETNIVFNLPQSSRVNMRVFNSMGQLVASITDSELSAGNHHYTFSAGAHGFGEGVYYLRFTVNGRTYTHKIVEIR